MVTPTDCEVDGGQSTGLSRESEPAQVIDDDDAVIVPAPEASAFIPKKPASSAAARTAIQRKKSLEYRRTLIPILLTTGTLMLVLGILRFFTGPDSMLQNVPAWITIIPFLAGAVFLALAAVNMISVKKQLAVEREQASPTPRP